MVASGLVGLGYNLILLDDCWSSVNRSASGELQPDAARFPSGMPALVSYINARGLSLGLYTCAGTKTCKYGRPGSYGHYEQDAATLVGWGVEWIKADKLVDKEAGQGGREAAGQTKGRGAAGQTKGRGAAGQTKGEVFDMRALRWRPYPPSPSPSCATGGQGAPHEYFANFSRAINATGTPIVFHSCEWGLDNVAQWGPSVTQAYRVRPDHLPFWSFNIPNAYPPGGQGTGDIIEGLADPAVTAGLAAFSYPDPDFVMTGLFQTEAETLTEFSFWCLWSAPLIVATDVRNMSTFKRSVLTNEGVLAIQRDAALSPAARLRSDNSTGAQLWVKHLAGGDVAVILYNAADFTAASTLALSWAELGPPWDTPNAHVSVFDLWSSSTLAPSATGGYETSNVPPHGSVFWRLSLVSS